VIALAGTNAIAAAKLVFTMRIVDALARRLTIGAAGARLPELARGGGNDSTKLQSDLERLPFSLQIVVDGVLWRAAPLSMQMLISLAVLAALIPLRYAVLLAAILAAYGVATIAGAKQFNTAAKSANAQAAAQGQTIGDILRNARRVVFSGAIPHELTTIAETAARRRAANERVARLIAGTAMRQFAVLATGITTLLFLCAKDVAAGTLTPGDFVLVQAYAFRLALPLGGFGYIMRQAGPALANIGETLAINAPTTTHSKYPAPAPSGPAEIVLDNVGFRYGDKWIIRNASARIPAGAFAVIFGPNGAGKSTLAQIIAGLIEPHEGAVTIGGACLSQIAPDQRHRFAFYAPQSTGLFNRTLRDNALYPPTRVSEDDLAALLQEWRFYADGRPVDLDLAIGEQGAKLSGGQIQKLELARISGVPAPIIILDEITAALDRTSEARTIADLKNRFQNRTTLILITHSIRMATSADLAVNFENGHLKYGAPNSFMDSPTSGSDNCIPVSEPSSPE